MVANAIDWPVAIFPRAAKFRSDSQSRSGGLSMTGSEQITVSNATRWRASVKAPVLTENSVLAWRALVGQMEGRTGTILVPKWERYGVRDANGRELNQVGAASYDADALNFDLTGFGQSDVVHATLATSAPLGATRISVTVLDGDGPRPGQYFGIGNRLYLCHLAWRENEGDPLRIQFGPRLRSAAAAGTRVILDRPVCLMRFADDVTGELELDMGLWGRGMLDFVEAI